MLILPIHATIGIGKISISSIGEEEERKLEERE
jgi:hypothetical protein